VDDDAALVARLRAGDETAFVILVRKYQAGLVRLAQATVGSNAVAQEVTQDTWLAVLRGVERYESRSSFKTWLYRILLYRARSAADRERRAGSPEDVTGEHFDGAGAWASPVEPWVDRANDRLTAERLAQRVTGLLPMLPYAQQQVVVLRDVEGLGASEVTELLGITDGNQRVLLHRGRARLRSLLAEEVSTY